MAELGERSRHGIWPALAQAGLAGVAGAVMTPAAAGVVVIGLFAGSVGFVVLALGFFAMFVALLTAVAKVAPEESWLTGTRGGRMLWGLVVAGAGAGLWLRGWGISDEAGLAISRFESLWVPATGVVFALVAGTLLRRWYLALGSLTVLVVLGLFLLKALADALPSDVDKRLADAQVSRESIVVASVPGYHVSPNQTSWQLSPDDEDPNPPSPYVSLYSLPDTPPADCQIDPYDTKYQAVETCEADRPGLFYVQSWTMGHTYVHRVDGRRLVLIAPRWVDRAVLRDAVLAARVTDGSATTAVPGYRVTSTSPDGTTFTPDDRTLLPGSRKIAFQTQFSVSPGQCTYGAQSCEVESATLRYERYDDAHEYVRVMGTREVRVRGGMAVGKDVLRTAALAAHPATDDELRQMLPPARPSTKDRSGMRELARTLFGTR